MSPKEPQRLGRLLLILKSIASKQGCEIGLAKRVSLSKLKFHQKDKAGKCVFGETTAPLLALSFIFSYLSDAKGPQPYLAVQCSSEEPTAVHLSWTYLKLTKFFKNIFY